MLAWRYRTLYNGRQHAVVVPGQGVIQRCRLQQLAATGRPTTSAAAQQPPADRSKGCRLNKRMSELGICSRREADQWIANGWVKVNGQTAGLGVLVTETDEIEVQRAARAQQKQQVTVLLHKPVGYVSSQAEDGYTPAVALVKPETHWSGDRSPQRFFPSQRQGLAPAGRLDIDSTGLLVLTQDGRVAKRLVGEDSDVDKEYLVRVQYLPGGRRLPQGQLQENVQGLFPAEKLDLLRHGLVLDGVRLRPAKVDWQNPEQLRFELREGRKRQIRRMCEAAGLTVVALKRVRIGKIRLGELPLGQWRYLAEGEQF